MNIQELIYEKFKMFLKRNVLLKNEELAIDRFRS